MAGLKVTKIPSKILHRLKKILADVREPDRELKKVLADTRESQRELKRELKTVLADTRESQRELKKVMADARALQREIKQDARESDRELKKILADARESSRELKRIVAVGQEPGFAMMPLPSGRGKPRVLVILQAYPNFSETYMHEEIGSLKDQFDVRIITYRKSGRARRRAWQHQQIEYKLPDLAYAKIEAIHKDFELAEQQDFLRKVGAVVEEFSPHVMHCHYLGLGLLMKQLAERHHVPFTMRTHSMDILSEPAEKVQACCAAVNGPWCLRVLAFPESGKRLIEQGMNPDKVVSCWPVLNFEAFYKPEKRPPTGRILCSGPAIKKKAHKDFVDLAVMMHDSGLTFDLYARGPALEETSAHNARNGNVITISYADPEEMPDVYPRYDWMVYPGDLTLNKVGLAVGIIEAQASGIGVCWQELPGRRQEQLDFLAGGGFLYKTIDEIPDIISRPYPEEMRQAGFEAARRCDIEQHKHLLSEVWESVAMEADAANH